MPRLKSALPRYCHHRSSGQAFVRLDGRDRYLGKHGSPESRREYDRLIAEWAGNGRALPPELLDGPTVDEVILAYWRYAEGHYTRDGKPTRELSNIRDALRPVRKLYGHTAAAKFRPSCMEAVLKAMIASGLRRTTINYRAGKIRRMFRWAVRAEMVPPSVSHAIREVPGIKHGRDGVKEGGKVRPVPPEDVAKVLPLLTAPVAAMARLQSLSGMRPGEVVPMRASEIDRSGEVWEYRPPRHKTDHLGHERVVFLGPKAQAVLAPFLAAAAMPGDPYLFRPADATAASLAKRRTKGRPARKAKRVAKPRRAPGECYSRVAYGSAIRRACKAAGVEQFGPNRLRHSLATSVRERFGLEGSQVVLGHAKADVTQVYAERDHGKARAIMAEVG